MNNEMIGFCNEFEKLGKFGNPIVSMLTPAAVGGVLGALSGRATGHVLGKYPGQSRDYGAQAGAVAGILTSGVLGDGKIEAVLKDISKASQEARYGGDTMGRRPGVKKAKPWGRFAKRTGRRYVPELAAGALAAALMARRKPRKKDKPLRQSADRRKR